MAYTIERYPTHLIGVWTLRDGRSVTLRPILPQDAPLMQAFVRRLSPTARYRRFLVGLPELTPGMLDRFTQVNYREHLALVAVSLDAQLNEHIVGEARYVADAEGGCEFALAVDEAWQGQGLGQRLLSMLIDAATRAGCVSMRGDVLRDNASMLGLARRLGFAESTQMSEPRLLKVERMLRAPALAGPAPSMVLAA